MEGKIEFNHEFVLVAGSLGMLSLTAAVAVFIYLFQRKVFKQRLERQRIEDLLRKQELKSTYSLLEGQDIERQRIAEDLHDNLGSVLVTLGMYANTILNGPLNSQQREAAEKVNDYAQKAAEVARSISHRLDTGSLQHFGLQAAIQDLAYAVNQTQPIQIETSINLQSELTSTININLYRILQELISNTLRHAKAQKIRIDITDIQHEYVSCIYQDSGIGMSRAAGSHSGMGLRNISSRVERLGGNLQFGDQRTGFSCTIEIPLS